MTESQRYALWLMFYELRGDVPDRAWWATWMVDQVARMLTMDQMEPEQYTNGTVIDVVNGCTIE